MVNWRNRVETDINEVLQAHTVFMNVPRGIVAAKDDLREAFGSDDHLTCAKVILEKGELEVRVLCFCSLESVDVENSPRSSIMTSADPDGNRPRLPRARRCPIESASCITTRYSAISPLRSLRSVSIQRRGGRILCQSLSECAVHCKLTLRHTASDTHAVDHQVCDGS